MRKPQNKYYRRYGNRLITLCILGILTGCQQTRQSGREMGHSDKKEPLPGKETQQPENTAPLRVYSENLFKGDEAELEHQVIYAGETLPKALDNRISSLILKKGYQLCISDKKDGKGPSKILIAAKRDIRIPELSEPFNNTISFVRVLPWKNSIKKGYCGGSFRELNCGWYYEWWGGEPLPDIQWTPMAFGRWHCKPKWMDTIIATEGVQDLLTFNEIDHKGHQGAKDGYLFSQANAVKEINVLMGLGLRMGSPNLREGGPNEWLPKFWDLSKEKKVRMDFLGVHWYDWDGIWKEGQAKKKGAEHEIPKIRTPEAIFARFKGYLEKIHNKYDHLPIWITEFNCNPGRDTKTQIEFLNLALPYLDSCPYVERYAYFQPFGGNGKFREGKGGWGEVGKPLTEIGKLWRDHPSVPAMDKEVYLGKNNLFEDEVEDHP